MNHDKLHTGAVLPVLNTGNNPAPADFAWLDEGARLPPIPQASLDRALRVVWLWKWRLTLLCMLMVLAGLAYLLIAPERYTAHATVIVGVRQSDLSTDDQARSPPRGEPDIDGATRLMRARASLQGVAKELALGTQPEFDRARRQGTSLTSRLRRLFWSAVGRTNNTPSQNLNHDPIDMIAAQLEKDIRIERIGRSALLDVSYSSSDPALAAAVVNTLGRISSEDAAFLTHLTLAERSGFQIVKMSVMTEALPPNEPFSPNATLILGSSVALGLLAAFGLMLVREFSRHQTVLGTAELIRRGIRPLGLVPEYTGAGATMVVNDRGNVFSASVASLHAELSTLPRSGGDCGLVLLITSALPSEGKSTTVAALATSMAASGSRVLLIDTNLRSPVLDGSFNLELQPGLSECVGQQASADHVIRHDPATGVYVLTAGENHVYPLGILNSDRLSVLLDNWRTHFDFILIDTPPISTATDARVLVQLADHVIVVARWGKTSLNLLSHTLQMLDVSETRLAGVVVSRVDFSRLSAYSHMDAQIYGQADGRRDRARRN